MNICLKIQINLLNFSGEYSAIHMYTDNSQFYHSFPFYHLEEELKEWSFVNITRRHSLHIRPKYTVAMVFWSKTNRKFVQVRVRFFIIMMTDKCMNFDLILYQSLRFKHHVSRNIQRSYGSLKISYTNKNRLGIKTKKILCNRLVLSQLDYCSPLYDPGIVVTTSNWI